MRLNNTGEVIVLKPVTEESLKRLQGVLKGGLSLADCYTSALGKLRQAEIVTGDLGFQRLQGEITIRWINH